MKKVLCSLLCVTLVLSSTYVVNGKQLSPQSTDQPTPITQEIAASQVRNSVVAQESPPLKRHTDIVFVVEMQFYQNNLCNQDGTLLENAFQWLTGEFDDDGNQPIDGRKGMARLLDEKLKEKGVIPRYGLVVFNSNRDTGGGSLVRVVDYLPFGPDDQPTSDDLWTSNVGDIEAKLIERYLEPSMPGGVGNSDGYLGQDAIMRVLGRQVHPDDVSLGVEPAYNFNPGSRNIILITDSDTDVEQDETVLFPVQDPDRPIVVPHPDHERRDIFHKWISQELEDEGIALHTFTPELFGANGGDKDGATQFENENRSRMHIFPELLDGEIDEWVVDDNYIHVKERFMDPNAVDRPLYLLFGISKPNSFADPKSYSQFLGNNCLSDGSGTANVGFGNWAIRSRVKHFHTNVVDRGHVDFLYGDQMDFPDNSKGVRIRYQINLDGDMVFETAELYGTILQPNTGFTEITGCDSNSDDCPPPARPEMDIEIRMINGGFFGTPRRLQVFINGAFAGHFDNPPNPSVSGLHHVAMHAGKEFFVRPGSYLAFDTFEFFLIADEYEFPLESIEDPTPLDFEHTSRPFKQLFATDFGTTGGSQYDLDVYGIKWSRPADNATVAYWLNPDGGGSSGDLPYTISNTSSHVYSKDFQSVHYLRLAKDSNERDSLGTSWTLLPVQPGGDNDVSMETLDKNYTPTVVDVLSDSMFERSRAFEAKIAGTHLFYNGSSYDVSADAEIEDENAIATDKYPFFRGETAGFENCSSYSLGINGVILDIERSLVELDASDFEFRIGDDNMPSGWQTAPAPVSITRFENIGDNASDRYTIIWNNGDIKNTWLEVKVLADRAGFCEDQVFYFGSLIGECAQPNPDPQNPQTQLRVDAVDLLQFRRNYFTDSDSIENRYDFNRSGRVDLFDVLPFRFNFTNSILLITPEED